MRKDLLPFYRVLGLNPGAGPDEIRRAYRQLVQQWHPDLFKPGSPMQTTAEDMTKEINEAYAQLYRKKLYRHYPPPGAAEPKAEAAPLRAPPRRRAPEPKPAPSRPPGSRWGQARAGLARWRRRRGVRWAGAALVVAAVGAGLWAWRPDRSLFVARVLAPPHAAPGNPMPPARAADPIPAAPAPAAAPAAPPAAQAGAGMTAVRRRWPVAADLLSLASPPRGSERTADPAAADADKLDGADKLIVELFEVGDTRARVRAVQGWPDEEGASVFRYGSSLVYFRDGRVRGWVDRLPRLRVRPQDDAPAPVLDRFSTGSSRAEVVRAQGRPDVFSIDRYLYGSSEVRFAGGRVGGWTNGDVPLRAFDLPALPFARPEPPRSVPQ